MTDHTGKCKLCHKTRKLSHSHIVPEFIYGPLYDEDPKRMLSVTKESTRISFPQKGERDYLLCADCEQHLNKHYEQKSLATWQALIKVRSDGNLKIDKHGDREITIEGHDPSFKLLFLSILWRASVSNSPTYSAVNLGPHEERLRNMILTQNSGADCDYPVSLHFLGDPDLRTILPPRRGREGVHRVYRLVLDRVVVVIFVASHLKQEESLYANVLKAGAPLRIPILKGGDSPIIHEIRKVLENVNIPTGLIQ